MLCIWYALAYNVCFIWNLPRVFVPTQRVHSAAPIGALAITQNCHWFPEGCLQGSAFMRLLYDSWSWGMRSGTSSS